MENNIRKWDEANGVDESEQRMAAFLERETDGYAILQLHRTDETAYERFKSYASLNKEPDYGHYEVVYTGGLSHNLFSADTRSLVLESLYESFNVDYLIPEDYTGHSLSVSDIVALKIGSVVSFHYVDTIGFQELPDFMNKSNYLRSAEMALEDDYNMIDGIAGNNGSKEEQPVQKSVLDDLKKRPAAQLGPSHKKKTEEWEL